jgi:hypothetical protein
MVVFAPSSWRGRPKTRIHGSRCSDPVKQKQSCGPPGALCSGGPQPTSNETNLEEGDGDFEVDG